jgi:hypothetical protein
MKRSKSTSKPSPSRTAAAHRTIQRGIDKTDRKARKPKADGPMQAGARVYPEPPFPKQHHAKPGHESRLNPAPSMTPPSIEAPTS